MQNISIRFIQSLHLRNVSVETIDYLETYVQQEDHFLVFSARNLLIKYFNDGTIFESEHENFIAAVFAFYCEAYNTYLKNVL